MAAALIYHPATMDAREIRVALQEMSKDDLYNVILTALEDQIKQTGRSMLSDVEIWDELQDELYAINKKYLRNAGLPSYWAEEKR